MGSPENYHNIPELYISINEEEKNEGMPYIFGSRLFYHTKMNNMAEKKAYRSEDNVCRKKQSTVATMDSRRKKVPFFLVVAISKAAVR